MHLIVLAEHVVAANQPGISPEKLNNFKFGQQLRTVKFILFRIFVVG